MIFNDGVFDDVSEKKVRDERMIDLVPGEKMVYGAEGDKGLAFDGFSLKRVAAADASVWDASMSTAAPAMLLGEIDRSGDFPTPMGIFRQSDEPCFEEAVNGQIAAVRSKKGPGNVKDLIYAGDIWSVE